MNLAIIGDVHGHLALMYAVLGRWQKETGRRIDLILQCGDMGSFLPTSQLDRATKRWSEQDPEELGFGEFAGDSVPPTLLDPRPLVVFIPGNHEDFVMLDEREKAARPDQSTYSVSNDGRIHALRSGRVWTFAMEGEAIRVAGISGIAREPHRKGRHPRYYLSEADALRLAQAGPGSVDILISHDGPSGLFGSDYRGMAGSDALRLVIEETSPKLAFFAHYDREGEWSIGTTRVVGMGKCGYVPSGSWPIASGGFAIVSWKRGSVSVERLASDWVVTATRFSWRRWGRPVRTKSGTMF